jgi:SlyX protein
MEKRATELEIRLTHMEVTLEVLDKTIITQQGDIDRLKLQISILEKKLKSATQSQLADEKDETPPPHY